MRGQLAALRLPTLLQALEGELFTGVLRLDSVGEFSFVRGRVAGATVGGLTGLDAVFEAFLAPSGLFVVEEAAVVGAPLGDTLALVMEGCRVADEWQRHRKSVFAPRGAAPAALIDVWSLFDGRRSLERVARAGAKGRAVVVGHIEAAVHDGALVLVGTSDMPVVTDFDDVMRRGREALKQRQLSDAIEWFSEGVRLRPDDRVAHQNLRHAKQLAVTDGSGFQRGT